MSVIYRYPLEITDRQTLMIPKGGWFLSAQAYQKETLISSWWFLPDPDAELEPIAIRIIGTGNSFDTPLDNMVPLATVVVYLQHVLTPTVWHIFEEYADTDDALK